jgi:hypothetical protein
MVFGGWSVRQCWGVESVGELDWGVIHSWLKRGSMESGNVVSNGGDISAFYFVSLFEKMMFF